MKIEFDPEDEAQMDVPLPAWLDSLRARIKFAKERMICRLGRHDYEARSVDGPWVLLECFYCLKQKKSHLIEYQAPPTPAPRQKPAGCTCSDILPWDSSYCKVHG